MPITDLDVGKNADNIITQSKHFERVPYPNMATAIQTRTLSHLCEQRTHFNHIVVVLFFVHTANLTIAL